PQDRRYPRGSCVSASDSCRLCARRGNERRGRPKPPSSKCLDRTSLVPLAVPAPAAAATAAAALAVARALLLARARRCALGALDQLLGTDSRTVLVLLDQLQADPPTRLVNLLDEHVEDVPALDHVLDVADPPRADVRHV